MALNDPAGAAQRWAQRLGQSGEKVRAGVQAVQVSPTSLAANAVQKWQARVQDPQTAQKFVNSLNRVTNAAWQDAMINKGIPRMSSGATSAQPKMQSFLQQFFPFLATGVAQVKAMPSMTLEDRIARSAAMQRYTHGFPRK